MVGESKQIIKKEKFNLKNKKNNFRKKKIGAANVAPDNGQLAAPDDWGSRIRPPHGQGQFWYFNLFSSFLYNLLNIKNYTPFSSSYNIFGLRWPINFFFKRKWPYCHRWSVVDKGWHAKEVDLVVLVRSTSGQIYLQRLNLTTYPWGS